MLTDGRILVWILVKQILHSHCAIAFHCSNYNLLNVIHISPLLRDCSKYNSYEYFVCVFCEHIYMHISFAIEVGAEFLHHREESQNYQM